MNKKIIIDEKLLRAFLTKLLGILTKDQIEIVVNLIKEMNLEMDDLIE